MVGFIIGLAIGVLSIIFRGFIALIFRFDILNAIIVSGWIQLFMVNRGWSSNVRWGVFFIIFLLVYVLQNIHNGIKIIIGIFSTVLIMAVGYGWMSYETNADRRIVVMICMVIGIFLNFVYCPNNVKK